ncbi:MAG: DUF2116 family Zn-ribbon domain-containing protein [Candidatus Thermoplasmatota archaeon]|nr:DUF2116 family Zn-ribbon domain-containing protein [Candidatus Thermoplasmatota archaeon]
MAEKIPQHAHCQVCGKAVPVSETLCSEECKQKYEALVKKRKMMVYLMYGLIGAVLVMYLFGSAIL